MSDPEVLPAVKSRKEALTHKKDPRLSHSVRELGRLGLSKHAVCVSLQIRDYTFKKYYLDEYLEGQSELQRGVASTAIQEAMNGNTPILLHLLKTKLGWSEQQVIEHIGEVKAVVSAKPLSKEEFAQRYLAADDED